VLQEITHHNVSPEAHCPLCVHVFSVNGDGETNKAV